MNPLQKNIMAILMGANQPLDTAEITLHLNGENRHRVQGELHILDDDGAVEMCNGFYKPSAAYRRGDQA